MSKFECSKIQNYDTQWTRCIDDCSETCKGNNKPDECALCAKRINSSNKSFSKETLEDIRKDIASSSISNKSPIKRSCCFGRTPTQHEVPLGADSSRYTIYDCAYGFTEQECSHSLWLDNTITSTRWREDDCSRCTCCESGDEYCLQSGGCSKFASSRGDLPTTISQDQPSITRTATTSTEMPTTTEKGPSYSPPSSSPSTPSNGGY